MASLDHGFAVIGNSCSSSECDNIVKRLAPIESVGSRCLLDNTWCQQLASQLKNQLAEALPEIRLLVAVQCTYLNKSVANNWFVSFHQDRSIPVASPVSSDRWSGLSHKEGMTFIHGPDELLNDMLAVRLHLDDSTTENGPLRVIPDSHRWGTLTSEQIETMRQSSLAQPLIARRGNVVIMRPLLLHASSKSRTRGARRVLHFLFAPHILPMGLEWRLAV